MYLYFYEHTDQCICIFCNWPDASLEGARGKLIPVVVVALPSVSQPTTSHSVTNSILYVILICLKIISDLEFKGNNSQCRQGHPLLTSAVCKIQLDMNCPYFFIFLKTLEVAQTNISSFGTETNRL